MQDARISLGGEPGFMRFDLFSLRSIYLSATRPGMWLKCGKLVKSLRGKRLPLNLPNILCSNIQVQQHQNPRLFPRSKSLA